MPLTVPVAPCLGRSCTKTSNPVALPNLVHTRCTLPTNPLVKCITSSSADTLSNQICYSRSQGHQHVMMHSTTRTQYSPLPHLRVTIESMVTVTHESSLSCHGHHGPEQHSSHHEQPHSSPPHHCMRFAACSCCHHWCIGQHQEVHWAAPKGRCGNMAHRHQQPLATSNVQGCVE